jgi:DNA-directed RNA polymerase subunit M/transcription elongation factor TFIIS
MDQLGPAGDFLRLSAHYREMTDGELLGLAQQRGELTPAAQEALANEMALRRLKPEPEEPTPAPESHTEPAEPSPFDEDRQLVEIATVWGLQDAQQLQTLLDTAGIPFFMGPEKATNADAVTSNFAEGVSVQIMQVGWPWARQAMQDYAPVNDPGPKSSEEAETPARCPKCNSEEVVFEELVPVQAGAGAESPQKYKWVCDSCGNEWEDDGVVNAE